MKDKETNLEEIEAYYSHRSALDAPLVTHEASTVVPSFQWCLNGTKSYPRICSRVLKRLKGPVWIQSKPPLFMLKKSNLVRTFLETFLFSFLLSEKITLKKKASFA